MVLGNGPVVIWLDGHIGSNVNNRDLKKLFEDQVSASSEPDPLDALICGYAADWRSVGAPVIATNSPEEVEVLIEQHKDKDIKFICSATLGEPLIPKLVEKFPNILSYYIFCGYMRGHVGWAIDFVDCLQMFDHEDNLLARLTRDIASDFREHGERYRKVNDPEAADQCFQHAQTLEERAKSRAGPHHKQDVNFKSE